MQLQNRTISYSYPLTEVNHGTMLGNSYLGIFLWGAENQLHLSIGCASLWDHRGGAHWAPHQTMEKIFAAIRTGDRKNVDDLLREDLPEGTPARPTVIPAGRLTLQLASSCRLIRNDLCIETGILRFFYERSVPREGRYCGGRKGPAALSIPPHPLPIPGITALTRRDSTITSLAITDHLGEQSVYEKSGTDGLQCGTVILDMKCLSRFQVQCPDLSSWQVIPSYRLSPDLQKERHFPEPLSFAQEDRRGFCQEMPAPRDAGYSLVVLRKGNCLQGNFLRGISLSELQKMPFSEEDAAEKSRQFWKDYWEKIPQVSFPEDPLLQRIYEEGLFKFGAMSAPEGVPAGLQGPWIEDDRLPPWSADYHFNINVQMCYAPALRANLFPNLKRLLQMVLSWNERLEYNAKCLTGKDGGRLLPHAVDDTGLNMGSFWSGAIDNGCTAWIAQMMFDYADYTGDLEFLRNEALPFMKGAFLVYASMMERKDGKLCFPLSTSPEFRGAHISAAAVNSSFQLAACHRLTRNLIQASRWLRLPVDPAWIEVEEQLPQASLIPFQRDWMEIPQKPVENEQAIGLWEGIPLYCCHRHHSHLAGITPFHTLDIEDPQWSRILHNSLEYWQGRGMGEWTGWCMTWASSLHSFTNAPQAARAILELWHSAFVNAGGCSTHDAVFPGIFRWSNSPHIIQLDATMGAVSAVQDMLLHNRNGVLHLFAGTTGPVSFRQMPAPGGFRISADNRPGPNSPLESAQIQATRDQTLRLRIHTNAKFLLAQCGNLEKTFSSETILTWEMKAGDLLSISFRSA